MDIFHLKNYIIMIVLLIVVYAYLLTYLLIVSKKISTD